MKIRSKLVILILYLSMSAWLSSVDANLYAPSDDVISLTGETFQSTVFRDHKDTVFVVQFYNTYCPHCQSFAPIYKELATRLKYWKSVIRIAAIDCSSDENAKACSENNIEGYPTIFLFPPNAKFKDLKDKPSDLRSMISEWTVDDIEETLIKYLGNLSRAKRKYPKAIDAMKPIEVSDLEQVHRLYPEDSTLDGLLNDQQDLMFIVESEKSFLGRKLIIEYYRISSRLELRRILTSNTKLLRKILTDKDYEQLRKDQPLLLRINNLDGAPKAQVLVRGEAEHLLPTVDEPERQDFITNRFRTFLNHYYSVELKEIDGFDVEADSRLKDTRKSITNDIELSNKEKQKIDMEISYLIHSDPVGSKKIFAQDILKGISYLLTHEVRIKGDLNPKEYNTIRDLLTTLKKYLPLDKWDPALSHFVENLRTKLDEHRSQYDIKGISGQQMKDLLDYSGSDKIRLKYNDESWISCHESDLQHKGYTCSLWLLFHTLTVGEYVKAAPVISRPTLVLTTMRGYITRFLGCTVCSSNFAKESEHLESALTTRDSSVLWLWNTHNNVNQRLNNEKQDTHRKTLINVIYPSPERCKKCYITDLKDVGVDGRTLEDVNWDTRAVFEFMVDLYKPENVISPTELGLLLRTIRKKVNYDLVHADLKEAHNADLNSSSSEKWNIQSVFSTSDMSICLLLYLSSIIIVAIVCFSLNPKWRRMSKTK